MLSQSLFERLARAGWPVTMLREQYRMHPHINAFPSR
jgi:senataxin